MRHLRSRRGQAVLGRQDASPTPWLTERHGYDPTSPFRQSPERQQDIAHLNRPTESLTQQAVPATSQTRNTQTRKHIEAPQSQPRRLAHQAINSHRSSLPSRQPFLAAYELTLTSHHDTEHHQAHAQQRQEQKNHFQNTARTRTAM